MIDSLTVWHGPVFGLYGASAKASLDGIESTVIDCATTPLTRLMELLPEDDILAEDRNGLWLRGIHTWKSDDVTKAIRYLDKHPLNYDIAVTSDKPPLKPIKDKAVAVHSFEIPKNPKEYARQIEDWLMINGRGLDTGVALKLVQHCAPEPEVAQRTAVTLASNSAGGLATWDEVSGIIGSLVKNTQPVWQISKAMSEGDVAGTLATLRSLDDKDGFQTLRFLENRYRMLLLLTSDASMNEVRKVFPNTNEWVLKKTLTEARGTTPRLCTHALQDIATGFSNLLSHGHDESAVGTIIEQVVIKIATRHSIARRRA